MKLLNKYLNKYSIFIFAIITFIICFSRTPFWDETHAFDIACLKLNEIYQISRIEGHTFLWYLILKPFSNIKFYPYSMFFINWIFCILSIYILWKKAPFEPIIKAFITFSTPFLLYFAPVARCYSIGILLLFLICSFFPERHKNPILFTLLIATCANTNLMCAIGCFWIGIIFLFELIEKYKENKIDKHLLLKIFSIFFLCGLILFYQFIFVQTPETLNDNSFTKRFINFVIIPWGDNYFQILFHIVSSLTFYFIPFYLFKNSKKALVFILGTYLTLTFVFVFFYHGSFWNHYFYYIYFIVLFWIFKKILYKNKFIKFLFYSILFLAIFPFSIHEEGKMPFIYSSKSKEIANLIAANNNLKNAKLYTLEWWSEISPASNVYLAQKGINIYDYKNRNKRSFESLKDTFKLQTEIIDFDEFYKNTPKDFYILSMGSIFNQKFKNLYVIPTDKHSYILKTKEKTYRMQNIKIEKNTTGLIIYKVIEI